jgi:hypothetical protein
MAFALRRGRQIVRVRSAGRNPRSAALDESGAPGLSVSRGIHVSLMPKPRFHIRHLCRTFYLSEWWDE